METFNGASILATTFRKPYKRSVKGQEFKAKKGELVCASLEYIHPNSILDKMTALEYILEYINNKTKNVLFINPDSDLSQVRYKKPAEVFKQTQYPMLLVFSNNASLDIIKTGHSNKQHDTSDTVVRSTDKLDHYIFPSSQIKKLSLIGTYGLKSGTFVLLETSKAITKYYDFCRANEHTYTSDEINELNDSIRTILHTKHSSSSTKASMI